MLNLPKPSPLSMNKSSDEKFSYLTAYLQKLVGELERVLSANKSKADKSAKTVKDISYSNGDLIVVYTDGSGKKIEI